MLQLFRIISLIEGLSLLVLLFIAMPAKYYFQAPEIMPYVGMTHGILWLVYLAFSLPVGQQQQWSSFNWLMSIVLSVIPFGFILLERSLNKSSYAEI